MIKGIFSRERVIAEKDELGLQLYDKSKFGEIKGNSINYTLSEALFLMQKEKMIVKDDKDKQISEKDFIKKSQKIEPNFWIRYNVFKDLRERGYIVKTALKFGADFRVYDKGIRPGEDHAKWIVYPVAEADVLTWYEFSAKNRVAHSTKKNLLIGIVDEEDCVTYYEINWVRP
ncbi:MAG: tRNA-intron lyase [Candidatus Nanoarchaeia archaeon]|nr:tRNA-intron lyase [Candidatus Nanoarchaeia archaeon]